MNGSARQQVNLLPPERRGGLRQEMFYVLAKRLLGWVEITLVGITVAGFVIAGGLWSAVTFLVERDEGQVAQQVVELQKARVQIDSTNGLLQQILRMGTERLVWSDSMEEFLAAVPPGVTLERFSVALSGNQVEVAGIAPTRATLAIFEDRLANLSWVDSVESPSSNLVQPTDASFEFTVHVK